MSLQYAEVYCTPHTADAVNTTGIHGTCLTVIRELLHRRGGGTRTIESAVRRGLLYTTFAVNTTGTQDMFTSDKKIIILKRRWNPPNGVRSTKRSTVHHTL